MTSGSRRPMRRFAVLALAATLWLPCLHLFYARDAAEFSGGPGLSPQGRQLAAWQLHLWTDAGLRWQELARMRVSNAEWDFMGRSSLVWSLANIALREPASQDDCLRVMDGIIGETLQLEQQNGPFFFMMPYARDRPFVQQPARSQFLDGEIALMLAMRRVVRENQADRALLTERVRKIVARMEQSPTLSAESYPDE